MVWLRLGVRITRAGESRSVRPDPEGRPERALQRPGTASQAGLGRACPHAL